MELSDQSNTINLFWKRALSQNYVDLNKKDVYLYQMVDTLVSSLW